MADTVAQSEEVAANWCLGKLTGQTGPQPSSFRDRRLLSVEFLARRSGGPIELDSGDNIYVRKRVLLQVLQGTADANIRFEDLRSLLGALGFAERIRGDHHIFSKSGVAEILNL